MSVSQIISITFKQLISSQICVPSDLDQISMVFISFWITESWENVVLIVYARISYLLSQNTRLAMIKENFPREAAQEGV